MNNDKKFMKAALKEAKKGKGLTYPNPAVGAVIVKENKIIGKGYHKKAGLPHAEVEAIKSLNNNIPENSTIYVTLEPCSHYGKTPPCSDLIIQHKFKRVVIGCMDPNPMVNGNGKKKLEQAGLDVTTDILKKECQLLNEDFFYYIKNKKSFVILKSALTLDGKIATTTNDSKWITNEKSRKFAHSLRKITSATLIGSNTLRTDNPSLNIRLCENKFKSNTNIIVLSNNLNFDLNANLFKVNPLNQIHIFANKNIEKSKLNDYKKVLPNIYTVDSNNNYLNLFQVMEKIYELGFTSVLVEGGSKIIFNFLKKKLVNKIYFMYAPKILGNGIPVVNGHLFDSIKDSIKFNSIKIKHFDNNFMVQGYPEY